VLIVLVAGVFQALSGVLRAGNAIRYIPSPVMAGFQNAVAILLLLAQLPPRVGERPLIAVQLLANLARELRVRLRHATRMISELER